MSSVIEYFFYPLSPILSLVVAGVILLGFECMPSLPTRPIKPWVALAGTVACAAFCWTLLRAWPIAYSTVGYSGGATWLAQFTHNYHLDPTTLGLFAGIAVFTFLSIVFMGPYFKDTEINAEVLILTLFVASGMMLLVSADTLVMIFLGLELLSLPTYVLVGIQRRDRYSCEAALKYFLFGSFATVLLIFAITLLYAQFGSFEIPRIAEGIRALVAGSGGTGPRLLVLASLALIMISVGFKIGMVPFHMWLPDVYEGAPTPITGFMGSAVKLAGFGLAMRLMWGLFLPIGHSWAELVNWLAVITMFVGNLAAIQQDNLKRMFAYSSISHAGFLLLAIATLPGAGAPNPVFLYYYLIVYGLMFLGFFAILTLIERHTGSTEIHQISGMGFSHPVLGGCLALFALSSAGVPPTAGFVAKYFVFLASVRAGNTLFVVLGVISSVIGVYYYLRIIVYLYMKESKQRLALPRQSPFAFFCIVACALSMLYFAFVPSTLGLSPLAR